MGHMMNWPMPGFLLGMENARVFAFTQFLLLTIRIVNGRYFKVGLRNQLQENIAADQIIIKQFDNPFTGEPVVKGK